MELSQKRVNRVKDYLVSKGIDKKRIMGRGYGGSKPIASNDTEEQRMLNRRVEFIIRKN
jgi:outer membrane protein OmpA-like peptidoglycan-associated protein